MSTHCLGLRAAAREPVPTAARAALVALAFALGAGCSTGVGDRASQRKMIAPRPEVSAREGAVSASHPLAAEAGARMLEAGGNAIDAAAAVQFALNVVEPQSSGIGGGGFMLVHIARTGETHIVDSRERAPAAASPDMFAPGGAALDFAVASTSGASVGVPGTLLGVDTALKRWGTMSLAQTLAPAIEWAEKGFRVNRFLAADIARDERTALQPETAAIYRPGGQPLREGELLVQSDLAKTSKLIAAQGVDAFYRGPIARAIVEAQQRSRTTPAQVGAGRMTLADLDAYRVAIRAPLVGHYRGWTVAGMPPPSSGALTVVQMLKMLERFPIGDARAGFGFGAPNTLHVMTESMRLAFADRAVWIGDEDFVPVPKAGLLDQAYVDSRAAAIRLDARIAGVPAAGQPALAKIAALGARAEEGINTTHFSIVDKHGNVVSTTTTIEATWGSGITVPGWGFLLNNELTDFNFAPAANAATGNPGANDVAPRKRPRSSMAPTLLLQGSRPVAAFGSPGGATIINSVLNVTLNLVDHGMNVQQAIDAPRLSVTGAAGSINCEGGQPFMQPAIPESSLAHLRSLGHQVPPACAAAIGSVQAVVVDLRDGTQSGGADQRREGTVIGLPRRR